MEKAKGKMCLVASPVPFNMTIGVELSRITRLSHQNMSCDTTASPDDAEEELQGIEKIRAFT